MLLIALRFLDSEEEIRIRRDFITLRTIEIIPEKLVLHQKYSAYKHIQHNILISSIGV